MVARQVNQLELEERLGALDQSVAMAKEGVAAAALPALGALVALGIAKARRARAFRRLQAAWQAGTRSEQAGAPGTVPYDAPGASENEGPLQDDLPAEAPNFFQAHGELTPEEYGAPDG